ncbi:MAG: hypothetical protein IKN39_01780 [Clostridia bacterium]|nr:hypothetical protein [Clostridia bacterium]
MNIEKKLFESFVLETAINYILGEDNLRHSDFKSYLKAGKEHTNFYYDNPKFKNERSQLEDLAGAVEVEAQKQGFYYGFMCAVEFIKTGKMPLALQTPEAET